MLQVSEGSRVLKSSATCCLRRTDQMTREGVMSCRDVGHQEGANGPGMVQ
jgi:hypothetical protein